MEGHDGEERLSRNDKKENEDEFFLIFSVLPKGCSSSKNLYRDIDLLLLDMEDMFRSENRVNDMQIHCIDHG